jgi:N utilization substance protein A
MVVSELRGEKIDIIPWNNEPARFVAKALSPARVREVYLDDDGKEATVVVPDDQLALAIGKEGMNARLAARLTGWKIDIQSDTEFAAAEAEVAFGGGGGEEELSGRCSAILANGKRCPNASLPGSRFCGVPAHQSLEGSGSDYVGGIAAEEAAKAKLAEEEAALLASDALPGEDEVEGMIAEATPEATDSAIEHAEAEDEETTEPEVAEVAAEVEATPEADDAKPVEVPAGAPVEEATPDEA